MTNNCTKQFYLLVLLILQLPMYSQYKLVIINIANNFYVTSNVSNPTVQCRRMLSRLLLVSFKILFNYKAIKCKLIHTYIQTIKYCSSNKQLTTIFVKISNKRRI